MIYRRNPRTEKVFRAGLALARLLRLGFLGISVVAVGLMCVGLIVNWGSGRFTDMAKETAIAMLVIIAMNGFVWAFERLYRHGTQLK